MKGLAEGKMTQVLIPADLPTSIEAAKQLVEGESAETPSMTPSTRRRRQSRKKTNLTSTLKLEITNPVTGELDYAVHGTSSALDGLEDKDELVRTMQRCRCDNLNLSPPTVLINWDVSHEECANVVGKEMPKLEGAKDTFAVLKEPMGSQGKGIYFVRDVDEIHKVINEHRERAQAEPDFLDNLIAVKGRIPSWGKFISDAKGIRCVPVQSISAILLTLLLNISISFAVLQAEVVPSLLIRDRRKFHIRTYLVVLEKLHHPDLMDIFIFNRHEVRIAGISVEEGDTERNPMAHITNGALSNTTERVLLVDVPELSSRGMQDKLETFVAECFAKHLVPDIARRINLSATEEGNNSSIRKFGVAGLDLMVTEDEKIFLLEVNSNPAAPPEDVVTDSFAEHLQGFMHDLVDLVVGKPSPNFLSAHAILAQKGLLK